MEPTPNPLMLTAPAAVEARPGQPVTVSVTVTSPHPVVVATDVEIRIVGLDGTWGPHAARVPLPAPGEATSVELLVTPPVGTPAGTVALAVSAQPLDRLGAPVGPAIMSDLILTVGTLGDLQLELLPAVLKGNGHKRVHIRLVNRSLAPLEVGLRIDPAPGLAAHLRHSTVTVPARGIAVVRGRLTSRRRVVGPHRRFPFVVSAQGATTPTRVNGAFEQRPTLSSGVTRLVAVAVVLLLWVGVALAGVQALSQRQHRQASQPTAAAVASASAAQADGQSGSGGGTKDQTGTAARAAAAAAAAAKSAAAVAAQGARLNGTVAGPQPAGVSVSVTPTSLVDEQALGAKPATTLPGAAAPAAFFTPVSPATAGAAVTRTGDIVTAADSQPLTKLSEQGVPFYAPRVQSRTVSTVTGKDGSWFIPGIKAPGYFLVTFSKPGFQTQKYIVSPVPGAEIPSLNVTMIPGRGRLSGVVVGKDGKPLGGVALRITDGTTTLTTSTPTTGDVGHWEVSGLPTPGSYLVSASRTGFGTESRAVDLPVPPAGSDTSSLTVNLTLPIGTTTLSGLVEGPDENGVVGPIGGAQITATNGTVTRSTTSSTTAGQKGMFTLAGLPIPAGNNVYTVTISSPGMVTRSQTVDLRGGTPASPLSALPLGSALGSLTGTVADTGGVGVTLAGVVLSGPGGTYKVLASSNPAGSYRITGIAPGSYVLTVSRFGFGSKTLPVVIPVGAAPVQDVALTALPSGGLAANGSIVGYVTDATGHRITSCDPLIVTAAADCTVTATTLEDGRPAPLVDTVPAAENYSLPDPATVTSATAGTAGLLPGQHVVTVSVPGYEPASVTVQVPVGRPVTAPVVALSKTGSLTGYLTTVVGNVPGGTCVTATPATAADPTAGITCTVSASATGLTCTTGNGAYCGVATGTTYAVHNLVHGLYTVRVLPPAGSNYLPTNPASLQVGLSETVTYGATLHRLGRIDVTATEPVGSTMAPVPSGTVVTLLGSGSADAINPVDGTAYSFQGLAPGSYTLTAADPAGPSTAVPGIAVALDQTVPVSAVLTAALNTNSATGLVAAGSVTSAIDNVATGVPCATVTVTGTTSYAGSTARQSQVTLATDEDGNFGLYSKAVPADTTTCARSGLPTAAVLPLIASQVTVSVDTYPSATDPTGYTGFKSVSRVVAGGLLPLTVTPNAVTPAASLSLLPASSAGQPFAGAQVQVLDVAPGAGSVTVKVDPTTGALAWRDSGLAPGKAFPGTYTLLTTIPGYDPVQASYTLLGTSPSLSIPLTLRTSLTVSGCLADTHDPGTDPSACVSGATSLPGLIATVTDDNGSAARTVSVPAGGDSAVFPTLPVSSGTADHRITYTIEARLGGYAHRAVSVTLDPSASGFILQIPLDRLGTISGRVLGVAVNDPASLTPNCSGASGPTPSLPVSGRGGVPVTATLGKTTFSTLTATDGSYSITGTTATDGLATGRWTVHVGAAAAGGFAPAGFVAAPEFAVNVTSGSVSTCSPLFAAAPVDLTFAVTVPPLADGTAPVQPTLKLTPAPQGSPTVADSTDDGVTHTYSFTYAALTPTTYNVTASAPNYGTLSSSVTLAIGSSGNAGSLTLGARYNRITGFVTLSPVAGGTVPDDEVVLLEVCPASGGACDPPSPLTVCPDPVTDQTVPSPAVQCLSAATGSPSQFPFAAVVKDGNYRVRASAPGATTTIVDTTLLPADQLDFIDLTSPSLGISGGLTTSVSLPLTQVTHRLPVTLTSTAAVKAGELNGTPLTLTSTAGSGYTQTLLAQQSHDSTDAAPAGLATFTQVPAGVYTLSAQGQNGHISPQDTVTVAKSAGVAGADQPTALRADEVRIAATVTPNASSGSATPLVTVSVFSSDPSAGPSTLLGRSTAVASGATSIAVFVPTPQNGGDVSGTFVQASAPGFTTVGGAPSATSSADPTNYQSTIALTLQQVTGLTVSVQQGNSPQGVDGVVVAIRRSAGDPPICAQTTANGGVATFASGLSPGNYILGVYNPDPTSNPGASNGCNDGSIAGTIVSGTSTRTFSLTGGSTSLIRVVTPADAPEAPTGVTANLDTRLGNSATVTWSAPTETHGSTVDGFRLAVSDTTASTSRTIDVGLSPTTYDLKNLTPGDLYSVTVIAKAGSLSSVTSDPATVQNTPDVVTDVTGKSDYSVANGSTITVSWTPGKGSVTDYLVTSSLLNSTQTVEPGNTATFSYDATYLGQQDTFSVTAQAGQPEGSGVSGDPATGTATVTGPPVIAVPPTLGADGLVTVTPPPHSLGVKQYQFVLTDLTTSETLPSVTMDAVDGNTYQLTLTSGDSYSVTVAGINAFGTGLPSQPSAVVTAT